MINRRSFLGTLGASIVSTAVPAAATAQQPEAAAQNLKSRISLNGDWECHVDGKFYEIATVPSSRRPTGYYSLKRSFVLLRLTSGQRAFAHFEAITYWARL